MEKIIFESRWFNPLFCHISSTISYIFNWILGRYFHHALCLTIFYLSNDLSHTQSCQFHSTGDNYLFLVFLDFSSVIFFLKKIGTSRLHFCLFLLFSNNLQNKTVTSKIGHPLPLFVYFRYFQTFYRIKTVDFNRIRTRIIGVNGKHAYHFTTTTAHILSAVLYP